MAFPESLTTTELGKHAAINPMSIPPIIKHVIRAANDANIAPEHIFSRKQVTTSEGLKSRYQMTMEAAHKIKPVAEKWQPAQT